MKSALFIIPLLLYSFLSHAFLLQVGGTFKAYEIFPDRDIIKIVISGPAKLWIEAGPATDGFEFWTCDTDECYTHFLKVDGQQITHELATWNKLFTYTSEDSLLIKDFWNEGRYALNLPPNDFAKIQYDGKIWDQNSSFKIFFINQEGQKIPNLGFFQKDPNNITKADLRELFLKQ